MSNGKTFREQGLDGVTSRSSENSFQYMSFCENLPIPRKVPWTVMKSTEATFRGTSTTHGMPNSSQHSINCTIHWIRPLCIHDKQNILIDIFGWRQRLKNKHRDIRCLFGLGTSLFIFYFPILAGTLNPALQDRNGKPKKSVSTIIHILNDLLGASPQYRAQMIHQQRHHGRHAERMARASHRTAARASKYHSYSVSQ